MQENVDAEKQVPGRVLRPATQLLVQLDEAGVRRLEAARV
jgi:hypothetical protein